MTFELTKSVIDDIIFSMEDQNSEFVFDAESSCVVPLDSLLQTEAEELLQKAGFSFSNSPSDVIVKVFIEKGIYDIDLVNQQLLKYDQVLLGTTSRDS